MAWQDLPAQVHAQAAADVPRLDVRGTRKDIYPDKAMACMFSICFCQSLLFHCVICAFYPRTSPLKSICTVVVVGVIIGTQQLLSYQGRG